MSNQTSMDLEKLLEFSVTIDGENQFLIEFVEDISQIFISNLHEAP